jgi:hypothetical protein
MSEPHPTEMKTPSCPMCSQQTFLKSTHREHVRDQRLYVFKCSSCAVEYPVVSPARD